MKQTIVKSNENIFEVLEVPNASFEKMRLDLKSWLISRIFYYHEGHEEHEGKICFNVFGFPLRGKTLFSLKLEGPVFVFAWNDRINMVSFDR